MSDNTTGPDGLTDEERHWRAHNQREASNVGTAAWYFDFALMKLGRERLAHAETRAERDRLRAALGKIAAIENRIVGGDWDEIEEAREIVRALLGEVKP